ncbi:MAG: hypothetical protein QOJ19_2886, partial [Acidimicrobiia bacterium]|nr:hypothetical protein [Acidimicrobiia bacterium]
MSTTRPLGGTTADLHIVADDES